MNPFCRCENIIDVQYVPPLPRTERPFKAYHVKLADGYTVGVKIKMNDEERILKKKNGRKLILRTMGRLCSTCIVSEKDQYMITKKWMNKDILTKRLFFDGEVEEEGTKLDVFYMTKQQFPIGIFLRGSLPRNRRKVIFFSHRLFDKNLVKVINSFI